MQDKTAENYQENKSLQFVLSLNDPLQASATKYIPISRIMSETLEFKQS